MIDPIEQRELYTKANTLSGNALILFLEQRDLAYYPYWQYRKQLIPPLPDKPITKTVKGMLLKKQDGQCNICHIPIRHGDSACFDKERGDILCRRCSAGIGFLASWLRSGVMWSDLRRRFVPPE